MTTFLRLLADDDKVGGLLTACAALRAGEADARVFEVEPASFRAVPGAPFAYWVSDAVRGLFGRLPPFEGEGRTARVGLQTSDDFRFVRAWWEVKADPERWPGFAKGGAYSPFYADVYLVVNWVGAGSEYWHNRNALGGIRSNIWMLRETADRYFRRPGLTWPRRTTSGLSVRALAEGCIFADKGPSAFIAGDAPELLLALLALVCSGSFAMPVELQLAAADAAARSYEIGIMKKCPIPRLDAENRGRLGSLGRRAWSLNRTLDTVEETSHAFLLAPVLRPRLGDYNPPAIEAELGRIQVEIDEIAFDLYGFSSEDRAAVLQPAGEEGGTEEDDAEAEEAALPADEQSALLSWAVGVAFGRFDWRLATGERAAAPEPDPFDPLPARSPGMLPEGAAPFHPHPGILVDDAGHAHDLARLVEGVLERVEAPAPPDVRRWLRKEFFAFHLQRYSKSRRRAPLYWPLSTTSGSYTLWLYSPELTSQTLYTAVNDFVEPKLKQVSDAVAGLRGKSGRSREEEKQFEAMQALEVELHELRDTLLRVAGDYRPNHDDGVPISAAPLWPLFRHKPWQKLLKETWTKLEKGDYDWAHLAMAYRPQQVRQKCSTDKSLAIAHGLEELYVEPEAKPAKKGRARKAASGA